MEDITQLQQRALKAEEVARTKLSAESSNDAQNARRAVAEPSLPMKLLASILFIFTSAVLPAQRLAVSADGNIHDRDDIAASPIEVALIAKAGRQKDVVYWGYADHYWQTVAAQEVDERVSVVNTAQMWGGYNMAVFRNVRNDGGAAISALTDEINKSTLNDPLTIMTLGPMQVVGKAIEQSNASARANVTVVSHSNWNDVHATTFGSGEGLDATRYNWSKLGGLGVNRRHIRDQNNGLDRPYDQFYWLRDSTHPNLRWLWDRGKVAGKSNFDCSDAGVTYYVLTGDDCATPSKLKVFLTAP